MRWTVALISLSGLAPAQTPDAGDLVTRALAKDNRNNEVRRNYTYLRKTTERDFDAAGKAVKTETTLTEIMVLFEEQFERVVERNGKPLPPAEAAKQQRKMDSFIAERKSETAAHRARRLADIQKRRQRERDALREVPKAFDLHILRTERFGGRDTFAIGATPRPDYKPIDIRSRILPKFKGTLWIDKTQGQLVKVEAEALGDVSVGFVLARLSKGSRFMFETMHVNGEVWLPRRVEAKVDARLALLKKIRTEVEIDFSDYKKFQTESRIVTTSEQPCN